VTLRCRASGLFEACHRGTAQQRLLRAPGKSGDAWSIGYPAHGVGETKCLAVRRSRRRGVKIQSSGGQHWVSIDSNTGSYVLLFITLAGAHHLAVLARPGFVRGCSHPDRHHLDRSGRDPGCPRRSPLRTAVRLSHRKQLKQAARTVRVDLLYWVAA